MEATSSCVSKTSSPRSEELMPCSSKESGWTSYFEDFYSSKEDKGGVATPSTVTLNSSLISDASSTRVVPMKKNKRKMKGPFFSYGDDPLEDTACSPLSLTINLKDMEGGSIKLRNIRDQDANGFGVGLDLVNSISKIDHECSELYYKRSLTML